MSRNGTGRSKTYQSCLQERVGAKNSPSIGGESTVKKVGEGYQGLRAPLKRRNHSTARGRSQHTTDGQRRLLTTSKYQDSMRGTHVYDEELLGTPAIALRGEK
jgi:hypothetical protein